MMLLYHNVAGLRLFGGAESYHLRLRFPDVHQGQGELVNDHIGASAT